MECVLKSPILYLQNKLLILNIALFSEPWVQSEYRGKRCNFAYREPVLKNAIKWSLFIQNEYCKVHFIDKE
jgi:hypothetical protein